MIFKIDVYAHYIRKMDTLPSEIIVHLICADINAFIICALLMTSHGVRRAVSNGVPSLKSLVISNRYDYLAYIVHISTCGPATRAQLLRRDNVNNVISRALGMRIIEPIIDFTRIWRLNLDPEYLKFIFRAVVVSNEFKYKLAYHMSKYRLRFLRNTRQWIYRYIGEIIDVLENGALNINMSSKESKIEFYLASRESQIAPSLQDKLPQEKGNYEDVKIVTNSLKPYVKYGISCNTYNRKIQMNIIPVIINQEVANVCLEYSPYYEREFLSADEFLIATNYANDDDMSAHILSNNIKSINIKTLRYMVDCGYNKSILTLARKGPSYRYMWLINILISKNNSVLLNQIAQDTYFLETDIKKYMNWEQRVLSSVVYI